MADHYKTSQFTHHTAPRSSDIALIVYDSNCVLKVAAFALALVNKPCSNY